MKKTDSFRLLLALALTCAGGPGLLRAAVPYVRTDGPRFVDAGGRELIFHGLNIVKKNDTWGSYAWLDETGYQEPGVYSEACLQYLERHVAWAGEYGIHVVLDMHQDLYSMRFSNGAPEWATLTDDLPHVADGKVWSEAYVTSPAVQRAMDNFYANRAGPGGVGLQERYAAAWRKVAERFADNPTVVGYDLMNEPFAGSVVPQGMGILLNSMAAEMNRTGGAKPIDAAGVGALWATPAGRADLLARLADPVVYARVIDAAQPIYQQFEKQHLMPLFQRIADAIREVDGDHIIFLESNGAANMGIFSAIEPLTRSGAGRDSRQAYAPHGYDLVTDTAEVATAADARVGLIFARHAETARRLAMPMLVGEWGAYYGNAHARPAAEFICRQFEQIGCGDLYWAMEPDLGKQAMFPAFCRPYPMAVSGTLLSYRANPADHTFTFAWREQGTVRDETRVFLPKAYAGQRISVQPAGPAFEIRTVGTEGNCHVIIPALATPAERVLTVGGGRQP
ncbi:MAG: cellulase family glycosylhydrolase [Opitutae bacterium]|nr:cellulase family glycosylhydrolase [Opitutae bacterium]